MARAFIHQGVWRIRPAWEFDPVAQKRATLRVSAAAAVATLAFAALHDGRPAERNESARPIRIVAPELASIKIDDRVPETPTALSMFRRRAPLADDAVSVAQPEPASPPMQASPVREAEIDAAGMIRAEGGVYRLAGIALPETGRMCRRIDGLAVQCLDRAQSYLQLLVKGRSVFCERAPQISDGVLEANCRVGDADLAEQLVRQGWARAGEKPEERFVLAEAAAKRQKLGIWRE